MNAPLSEEKIFDLPPAIYGAGYVGMTRAHYESLQRENRVLALKNSGSLANNLCPDHRDKQLGKPCLACEIEQLRHRIEHALTFLEGRMPCKEGSCCADLRQIIAICKGETT